MGFASGERVLKTFANEVPDRVPINYLANPGIDGRLKGHFGLKVDDSSACGHRSGAVRMPSAGSPRTRRRRGDIDLLQREIAAWQKQRNDRSATVQWRFATTDARRKMKRLYPS